jgi:hypothetical protein
MLEIGQNWQLWASLKRIAVFCNLKEAKEKQNTIV